MLKKRNCLAWLVPQLKQADINSHRHCEARSNLMLHDGLSVNEIASCLAMTGLNTLL